MDDELTDSQIALLCDIGEFKLHELNELTGERKSDLDRLVSGGYAEPAESGARWPFKLTPKAHEFLGLRGAGLNE
jgi:hypothetical protein